MTDYEKDRLALDAAKRICRRGYSPNDAAKIVRLSKHAADVLNDWYSDLINEDAPVAKGEK